MGIADRHIFYYKVVVSFDLPPYLLGDSSSDSWLWNRGERSGDLCDRERSEWEAWGQPHYRDLVTPTHSRPVCATRIFKTCNTEYLVMGTGLFSLRLSN